MINLAEPAGYAISRSGLYVPENYVEEQEPPTGLDLFSGCGGFSLGMIQGGFRVLAGVEWEPAAATTYMANLATYPCNIVFVEPRDKERFGRWLEKTYFPKGKKAKTRSVESMPVAGCHWPTEEPYGLPVPNFFFGDIRRLTGKRICKELGIRPGELGCLFGSPPCQGFSTAGKRDVMDPRNSLMFEFARLVVELRPMSICLENVPNLLNMVTPAGIPVVDAFCMQLADGGYSTYEALRKAIGGSKTAKAAVRDTGNQKQEKPQKTKVRRVPQAVFSFDHE